MRERWLMPDYAALDTLMRRLLRLEDRLLCVLDRPEIPLHTNASENDICAFVTKRKISGRTASDNGREARDFMLGLAKTCAKLKVRFFDYLGARLAIPGPSIPNLPNLVREAPGPVNVAIRLVPHSPASAWRGRLRRREIAWLPATTSPM